MQRIVFHFLAGLTGILLLLGMLLLVLLRTDWGHAQLEKALNLVLAHGQQKIEIQGIKGDLPFDLALDRLQVSDDQGQWLEIQDLRLDWSLRDILQHRVIVSQLRINELHIKRQPRTGPGRETAAEKTGNTLAWPPAPGIALDLQELEVSRVYLGQEILGSSLHFELQAALALERTGDLQIKLDLHGLDRPGLMLQAAARYQEQAADQFDLQIVFQDDGLLQDILADQQLPRDTFLKLGGQGTGSAWQGQMELQAPGLAELSSDLDLDLGPEPELQAKGDLHLAAYPALEQLGAYLQDKIEFDIQARLNIQENVLHLQDMQVTSPRLRSRMQARIDLQNKAQQGNLQLDILDPGPLLAGYGIQAQGLQLTAISSGPLNAPEVDLELIAERLSQAGLALDSMQLDSSLVLSLEDGVQLSASGAGSLQGLQQSGWPQMARGLDLEYQLQLKEGNMLLLPHLKLQAHGDYLKLQDLSLDLSNLDLRSDLRLEVAEVDAWLGQEQQGMPSGRLQLSAGLQGNLQGLDLQGDFRGALQDLTGIPAQALAMTGTGLDFSGSLALQQADQFELQHLEINAQEFSLQATGRAQLQSGLMQGSAELDLPRLQAMQEHLPVQLQGGARLMLEAQGKLPGLDLDLQLDTRELVLHQDQPLQVGLQMQARDVLQSPAGDFALELTVLDQDLLLQSRFALQEQQIQLTALQLLGAGAEVNAELALDLQSKLLQGQLQGHVPDLGPLAALGGFSLQGKLDLEGEFFPGAETQEARMALELQDLQFQEVRLQQLQTELDVRDLLHEPSLQAWFNLSRLQAAELEIAAFNGDLSWAGQKLDLDAKGSGHFLHNLDLDLGLELELFQANQGYRLELQRLQGSFGPKAFELLQPLQLTAAGDRIAWQEFALLYGGSRLTSQGALQPEQISGFAQLQGFELQNLPLDQVQKLQGLLGGRLEFSGTGQAPRLQGNLQVHDLLIQDLSDKQSPGLQVNVDLGYEQGSFSMQSEVSAGQSTQSSLKLKLPVNLALNPWVLQLEKTAALQGQIQAQADLSFLQHLLLPAGQLLQGELLLDLDIQGQLQNPDLSGQLNLQKGAFEYPAQGILLEDLLMEADIQGQKVQIKDLQATDGRQGRLSGHGQLELDIAQGFEWTMELGLRDFRAVNSKDVQAWLEKGQVKINGDAQGAFLQGRLQFDRVQASIPEKASADIVHLNYTEKNARQGEPAKHTTNDSGPGYVLEMELHLEFPARVFVRGQGLDSEWQGNLQVTGNVRSPRLVGQLNVVRGHMMFLNRRFSLAEGSSIVFTGASPPAPALDITARHSRRDLVGIVRVTGLVQDMQLELDSEPSLPQDEILARVLFGRDLADITPFQAVMLANAVRSLAKGGGMDLMGQMRTVLDVDSIELGQDEETGEMQFGVGKYVHEKVYLQLEKGSEPGSDQVSVEVELSPRLSLESTMEADKQGGLGLFWKMDY